MAGLWDIVTVEPGNENQMRINITLLRTQLVGVAVGLFSTVDARNALEADLGRAFTPAELTDLTALLNHFMTGTTTDRLVYSHKVETALIAAELQLTDEAAFRTLLEITL